MGNMLAGIFAKALMQNAPDVKVSLIEPFSMVQAGEVFPVGVRLEVEKPWHIYWVNPGDTGVKTQFSWKLPEGWSVSQPMYPAPKKYVDSGLVSYVHEGTVDFVVWVSVPKDAKLGSTFYFWGEVNWLACLESCIPGSARVRGGVQVGPQVVAVSGAKKAFASMRSGLPKRIDREVRVTRNSVGDLEMVVAGMNGDSAYFFSESADWVEPGAEQAVRFLGSDLTLPLKKSPYGNGQFDRLRGVLQVGNENFWVDAPVLERGEKQQ